MEEHFVNIFLVFLAVAFLWMYTKLLRRKRELYREAEPELCPCAVCEKLVDIDKLMATTDESDGGVCKECALVYFEREVQQLKQELREENTHVIEAKTAGFGHRQNAAFYKSCAMCGKVPVDGDEPYHSAMEDVIDPEERLVICAAVKTVTGKLVCGPRHHHCFEAAAESGQSMSMKAEDQGFVDQWKVYMPREEALIIARKNKQLFNPAAVAYLFSEDLY